MSPTPSERSRNHRTRLSPGGFVVRSKTTRDVLGASLRGTARGLAAVLLHVSDGLVAIGGGRIAQLAARVGMKAVRLRDGLAFLAVAQAGVLVERDLGLAVLALPVTPDHPPVRPYIETVGNSAVRDLRGCRRARCGSCRCRWRCRCRGHRRCRSQGGYGRLHGIRNARRGRGGLGMSTRSESDDATERSTQPRHHSAAIG